MEKCTTKLEYEIYHNEYPDVYIPLCKSAIEAASKAYSVYSGFSVGAAVLLENNLVFKGSNQENIAYPSGMCAERVALFYANSEYPLISVRAIAVVAIDADRNIYDNISPCGSCRQVFSEIISRFNTDFDVILIGTHKTVKIKASHLLPLSFHM